MTFKKMLKDQMDAVQEEKDKKAHREVFLDTEGSDELV